MATGLCLTNVVLCGRHPAGIVDVDGRRIGPEKAFCGSVCCDAAMGQENDPISKRARILGRVGDEDNRHAGFFVKTANEFDHLGTHCRAERGERFVEKKQWPPPDERPGQSNPLPLATGKFRRQARLLSGQTDIVKRSGNVGTIAIVQTQIRRAAQPDIPNHRQVVEQIVLLKHHRDRSACWVEPGHIRSENPNATLIDDLETGDEIEQGRFAGAAGTKQTNDLPFDDFDIDMHRKTARIGETDSIELQCGRFHARFRPIHSAASIKDNVNSASKSAIPAASAVR